jgi:hypothetical protein
MRCGDIGYTHDDVMIYSSIVYVKQVKDVMNADGNQTSQRGALSSHIIIVLSPFASPLFLLSRCALRV